MIIVRAFVLVLALQALASGLSQPRFHQLTKSFPVVTLIVRDSHGRSVPRAVTRVLDFRGIVVAFGRTDSAGQFKFRVPRGFYYIQASHLRLQAEGFVDVVGEPETVSITLTRFTVIAGAESAASETETNGVSLKVYYATDRQQSDRVTIKEFYSNKREPKDELHLGTCTVHIPKDHRLGHLEQPSLWKLEFTPNPAKHVVILSINPESQSDFATEIAADIQRSNQNEVLVYVHGYENTFSDAISRTAQIAYDLQFDGPAVAYSWPSQGTYAGYSADEGTSEWTVPHLRKFLTDLAVESHAAAIHIVCHSLGARIVVSALSDAASQPSQMRLRQLILAAPDVDSAVFVHDAGTLARTAQRITMYASSSDQMLKISKLWHSFPRAGLSGKDMVVVPGVDTVDASDVDTSLIGHSYYADERSIISDIFSLMRYNESPAFRFGMQSAQKNGLRYWRFKP